MGYSPAIGRFIQRDPIGSSHVVESSPVIQQAIIAAATRTAERFGSTAADDEHLYQYADGMNSYQSFGSNPIRYNDPSGLKVVVEGPFAVYDNNGNPVYRYHYYNEGWFSTTFMYSKDYQRFEGKPGNTYDEALDCVCRGRDDFATAGTQVAQNAGGATGLGPTGDGLMMAGMMPVIIKLPHFFNRSFAGTGITEEALEAGINADLAKRTCKPGFNEFETTIGGKTVVYRPNVRPDGTISVGTAFPKK